MNAPTLLVFVIGVACAQYNNGFNQRQQQRQQPQLQAQQPLIQGQQRIAEPVAYPRILKQVQDHQFDGSFNYAYETEDGISAQAGGVLKNPGTENEAQSIQGSYSYTDTNGQVITVTYTADENGFRAEGAHLPTPPPIPEAIARALEYIRSLPPSDDNKF